MSWNRSAACAAMSILFAITSTPAFTQDKPEDEGVFVLAQAPLDEARGLCLDIPGHRDRVNVTRALVVHTCKRDIWNLDERFSRTDLDRGVLRMPAYNRCVVGREMRAGAAVVLAACDASPNQQWRFVDNRLMPTTDDSLCLTIGPEASKLTPGGRRLPSRHVARSVGLAECSAAAAKRQQWKSELAGS